MPALKLEFRRFEMKYLIPRALVPQLVAELLEQNLVWDPYVADKPARAYTVTSLYFDTPQLFSFYSKMAGDTDRFKLRLRMYGERVADAPYVFAEVKHRHNAVVVKRRSVLAAPRVGEALAKGWGFGTLADAVMGDDTGFQEFLTLQQRLGMIPMANITYTRTPLVGRFNPGLRVTFDEHILVSTIPDLDVHQHVPAGIKEAVMEVKYRNRLPHWFVWFIRRHGLERQAVSKYGYGIIAASDMGHLAYS